MSTDFETELSDVNDHNLAVDQAEAIRRHVLANGVVALAAITIASDGEVSLHQPPEQVADEPLVIFALIGALQTMSANLTAMLKSAEHRKPSQPTVLN